MGKDPRGDLLGTGTERETDQKCLQSYSNHLDRLTVPPKGRDID